MKQGADRPRARWISALGAWVALALLATACAAASPTAPGATATPAGTTGTPTPAAGDTPTSGPTPTKGPTAAPTKGPTATPTPPYPILPVAALDRIGIGVTALSFGTLGIDGMPPIDADSGTGADFILSDGRPIHFDEASSYHGNYITGYRIDGSPAVTPQPDTAPVADCEFTVDGFALRSQQDVRFTELTAALGAPSDDVTIDTEWIYFHVNERTLTYPGLTIVLQQDHAAKDKDVWNLFSILVTRSDLATPRGLKVGMTEREILQLFDTGDFMILVSGIPSTVAEMEVFRNSGSGQPGSDAFAGEIRIDFVDGKATRIALLFWIGEV